MYVASVCGERESEPRAYRAFIAVAPTLQHIEAEVHNWIDTCPDLADIHVHWIPVGQVGIPALVQTKFGKQGPWVKWNFEQPTLLPEVRVAYELLSDYVPRRLPCSNSYSKLARSVAAIRHILLWLYRGCPI